MRGTFRGQALAGPALAALLAAVGAAAAAGLPAQRPGAGQLDVVATAHLDTQWRWTIRTTIDEYLRATLRDNFALLDSFPHYVFSFEGAFRYQLMKEYYPEDYQRVRDYVKAGRWRVAGSWLDAVDVNIPSPESLYRHALYGNGWFAREFGTRSRDVFLPDCFGFGYALPTVAAHSGLAGFSTQKLGWGCHVGTPFDLGLWAGVDGSTLVAALNPGSYSSGFAHDLSADSTWMAAAARLAARGAPAVAYKYFGTGDTGGAPDAASVAWLERSVAGAGPLAVRAAGSDQLMVELTEAERAALPRFRGELLMTRHGVGCYTSQAAMKRWNRQNEVLGDAAERASLAAAWLGAAPYPRRELEEAWTRFLWHQFHDDLTGTSIPAAYTFSWNDERLSQNQFAGLVADATGAVARGLDTRVATDALPLVVFNPLALPRVEELSVRPAWPGAPPAAVRVKDPRGREVPAVVEDGTVRFTATVPPIGWAVYELRPAGRDQAPPRARTAAPDLLENARWRVRLGVRGIVSLVDKELDRECLAAPLEFQWLEDSPGSWPAWEIDHDDLSAPPVAVAAQAAGSAWEVAADGRSARGRLAAEGSVLDLVVRLREDRVDLELDLDWRSPGRLLKLAVASAAAGDSVTYDLGCGVVRRGLNSPALYEVPAQRWADLGDPAGGGGLAVLSAGPAGWDHPAPGLLRLSLVRTPVVRPGWRGMADQGGQDLGRHLIRVALFPHEGDWRRGVAAAADRFNQPLLAFQSPAHPGPLGRRFSLARLEDGRGAAPPVALRALKRAEETGEWVVRLQEAEGGTAADVVLTCAAPILAFRELNAAEEEVAAAGRAELKEGRLCLDFRAYQPRTLALTLAEPPCRLEEPRSHPWRLPADLDGVSTRDEAGGGDFAHGRSLAAELLPDTLRWRGVDFLTGDTRPGAVNMTTCRGQSLELPAGPWESLWLLAAADGARELRVDLDGQPHRFQVPDWSEFLGQWATRPEDGGPGRPDETTAGWLHAGDVAWVGTHTHDSLGRVEPYQFSTACALRLELPRGARHLCLPHQPQVRLLAATLVEEDHADLRPAMELVEPVRESSVRLLTAARAFADSLVVELASPNPGAVIRHRFTDDVGGVHVGEGPRLTVARDGILEAWAEAPGLATGRPLRTSFEGLDPRPALVATTEGLRPGLACATYEGAWSALPVFSELTPIARAVTDKVMVPEAAPAEDVGLRLEGFLRVPRRGLYTLWLWSDDGSRLWLGGEEVIDNDGLHGSSAVSRDLVLEAGLHELRVDFFQHLGGVDLRLEWEGPGLPRQKVPAAALWHRP